ncbi:hypothetical protein SBV1_2300025 [Verrucomicrobia bacterium]|nr:hypothetical protein SBV1_2300025 [Verrucomicrobiota bacterium]
MTLALPSALCTLNLINLSFFPAAFRKNVGVSEQNSRPC